MIRYFHNSLEIKMRITDIGNYHLLEMIGSGSYGKVYRGVNRTNNDVVAVKVIERKYTTRLC